MRWELVRQAALLLAAALLAFIRDIFPVWTERLLVVGGSDYFPWGVRISLCAAMVLFDSLLVLYFSRIVRLYRKGLSAARPTLPGDALLCSLVAVTAAGYIWLSISAASRFGLSMEEYMWIGRFFVQLCNFSYIALEALGALLFLLFLRRLRSDAP